jgi:hypothetical protein
MSFNARTRRLSQRAHEMRPRTSFERLENPPALEFSSRGERSSGPPNAFTTQIAALERFIGSRHESRKTL